MLCLGWGGGGPTGPKANRRHLRLGSHVLPVVPSEARDAGPVPGHTGPTFLPRRHLLKILTTTPEKSRAPDTHDLFQALKHRIGSLCFLGCRVDPAVLTSQLAGRIR